MLLLLIHHPGGGMKAWIPVLYYHKNNKSGFISENSCVVEMSTNSSEDLNTQVLIGECSSVLKQVQIDSDHLFRHLTEVNGKDTRVSSRLVV